MAKATISKGVKTKTTWANALKRDWQLYLLLMIPVALVVIFNYASYGGIRMVFMDYKPAKGYAGSKWVGWATFQKVFKDKDFIRALKSSIVFNLLDLAVGFPMPIILALILNELRFPRFKKVTQTILYLPHFLSWVIVGSVAYQMFRPTTGMVNVFLMNAGIIQNGIPFLTEKWHWAVTYLLIGVWQGMGWGTIIYLAATGTVFRDFFHRSQWFGKAFRRGGFLVFSYLITNLTLNIDRLVLENLIGHLAVTQYYVTSLIGKTLVLLVAPINTIIISYLTRKQERMNRRQFLMFTGIGGAVSFVFFICAQIGTPIFVKLFYGDLYESVKGMITVVNLSQILGVLSAYLFIVVLTFTEEKWQLLLQIFHLVVIVALVLIFTGSGGIMGFAEAVLIANAVRVAAVILLGLIKAGR